MHPVRALFRRNAWATARLLEFCIDHYELATVEAGNDIYGGIEPLFNHILAAETRYLRRLTGVLPDDHVHESKSRALPDLVDPSRALAQRWERLLESPDEPDWVPMAQCLHHGDDHRAQVGTALGRLGAEPPVLDAWHYVLDPESSAKHPAPAWAPALLRRCFGHHLWATRRLLEHCLDLTAEQLNLSAPGTYGAILPTLHHLVAADRGYLSRLLGRGRPAPLSAADVQPLLDTHARQEEQWRAYLETGPDFEVEFKAGDGTDPAWVITMQALHHGHDHRTHVGTVLLHHGLEAGPGHLVL